MEIEGTVTENQTTVDQEKKPHPGIVELSNSKILVVEDQEVNREILKDWITALGHIPILAEDGKVGLEAALEHGPDLVLLDIMMPGMSGFKVLERLKADDRTRDIPVLVITALNELGTIVRCLELGAEDILPKPFKAKILEARIGSSLQRKYLMDQQKALNIQLAESLRKLREAEEARDGLVHMIIHDLSGPLMSIMGSSDLLYFNVKSEKPDSEMLADHMGRIRSSAKQISIMIDSILTVSKKESGEMKVLLEVVEACDLLKETLAIFDIQAQLKGVKIRTSSPDSPRLVKADRDLLSRVLQNLMANALKYSPNGTEVTCSTRDEGDEIIMSVEDQGPGVPQDQASRIFDKFYQAQAPRSSRKGGVGLGLAFCKMAVEAMGGKIWVVDGYKGGACFNVALKKRS